jgi:NAD(P)-dependent dehydrogenase (short-subunit alcohol dehydrogenase family)
MAHYTNKKVLNPEIQAEATEPSSLRALFLLEPPGPLRIEAARGMETIMALLEAQFTLDVADEESVRRAFAAVERVAGQVPVFRLAYPRDYALLTEVIGAVLNAAGPRRSPGRAEA